jgi:hypothetical protein
MASDYKTIDGVKYDRALLELADECVAGVGDGRISKDDAAKLLESAKDGNQYTDTEHATIGYIKANYKWTPAALTDFDAALTAWLDSVDCTIVGAHVLSKSLIALADECVAGVGDGRISKGDAELILKAIMDDGKYKAIEKKTVAHIQANYKWTEAALKWFEGEIAKV